MPVFFTSLNASMLSTNEKLIIFPEHSSEKNNKNLIIVDYILRNKALTLSILQISDVHYIML
jgi:hypothetical protein